MTSLPASIEAYLLEAGFSPTEITILKRLLEGEALTLRELGAKTGKSTGVLDQATKKLLSKKILNRDIINGVPKLTVASLSSIAEWVEQDMREKRETLHRKHKDFEAFLATLELDKGRPEMEYFEGPEGIQQAYLKLLECGNPWLCYAQATVKEEDDPLCEFRVQLFRKRRNLKIFARVIAPDTALGKRFASRDVFEYRETKLIPEGQMPVGFEKIIAGDTVACFNHAEQRACFIRYGELADTQRKLFEMLWCMGSGKSEEECAVVPAQAKPAVASLETKTLSGLREFFVSKKSLVTMGVLAVISATITFGLYRQTTYLNTLRIRDQVKAIAATGAAQFQAKEVDALRTVQDVHTDIYKNVVSKLLHIQEENEGVAFVYLLRPTDDPDMFEFVAASDAMEPFTPSDSNGDGIINDADELVVPGDTYDVTSMDALTTGDFSKPVANRYSYTDQWGTFLTAYAPVNHSDGSLAGLLSVDMRIEKLGALNKDAFQPILYFVGFFVIFLFIRLAAFNRSLAKDLLILSRSKKVLATLAVCIGIALLLTYVMYQYTLNLMKAEVGNRLMAIVATASSEIEAEKLDLFHSAKDMQKKEYQEIFERLNEIRNKNSGIKYVYIFRKTAEPDMLEFVADADSSYELAHQNNPNLEEVVPPGTAYYGGQLSQFKQNKNEIFKKPFADSEFTMDKWGIFLSASAPIFNKNGQADSILGVDKDISIFYQRVNTRFKALIWFFCIFGAFIIIRIGLIKKS